MQGEDPAEEEPAEAAVQAPGHRREAWAGDDHAEGDPHGVLHPPHQVLLRVPAEERPQRHAREPEGSASTSTSPTCSPPPPSATLASRSGRNADLPSTRLCPGFPLDYLYRESFTLTYTQEPKHYDHPYIFAMNSPG
ncbi:hypothetical protein CEXT_414651 [Caerostris extrusa]|uniref:Uncharacterized protein n=1 Tax=Caerostris extrusa TaxID=172846 RepID=A0AAV4PBQ6_CAEEX|nr:hypothetical protein CEXT_414651 [Caerostris extrusa]